MEHQSVPRGARWSPPVSRLAACWMLGTIALWTALSGAVAAGAEPAVDGAPTTALAAPPGIRTFSLDESPAEADETEPGETPAKKKKDEAAPGQSSNSAPSAGSGKPAKPSDVAPPTAEPTAKPDAEPAPEKTTPVQPSASESAPAAAAPAGQPGATPDPSALVAQLGDESYEVRQQAAEQLAKLGLPARQALEEGLHHADPEVRRRCRWILADVLEADYQRRLEAFVADTEGKQQHDIPGWNRYCRLVGSDRTAREFFRDMQRAERGLLISTAAGTQAAAESLTLRLAQMQRMMQMPQPGRRNVPSAASVAAVLFVCSDPELKLPENLAESPYLTSIIQQEEFRKAVVEGDEAKRRPPRRILGQWISRPGSPNTLYMKLNLASQYEIPEGIIVARRLIEDRNMPHGHFRAMAINVIGKVGGKSYAGLLDGMLDDQTVCFQGVIGRQVNGKNVTTQIKTMVCDIALTWLVHLTGQDHAQYGHPDAKQEFERMSKIVGYQPNFIQMGYEKDEVRAAALKKWREYVADHPLPDLPDQTKSDDAQVAEKPQATETTDAAPKVDPNGAARGEKKDEERQGEEGKQAPKDKPQQGQANAPEAAAQVIIVQGGAVPAIIPGGGIQIQVHAAPIVAPAKPEKPGNAEQPRQKKPGDKPAGGAEEESSRSPDQTPAAEQPNDEKQQKAAQAGAEQPATAERAIAEKATAEARKQAEQQSDKAATEKAAEKKAAVQKASQEKEAAEKKAAEDGEKAKAQQKLAQARAVVAGRVILGAARAAIGGNAKMAEQQSEEEGESGPRGLCVELADRSMVQNLAVAQELLRRKQYAKATELLDQILAAEGNYAYQPDRQVGLWCCLRPQAENLLGGLPDEGMAIYRLQFEPLARAMLNQAIESGDAQRLAAQSRRFFHTRAGAEATYLLAMHHCDAGRALEAAMVLERLRQESRDADDLEPALSMTLAACWFRCGMPREAERVVRDAPEPSGAGQVVVGGKSWQWYDPRGSLRDWLAGIIGPPLRPAVEGGWPMFGGGPDRNPRGGHDGAYPAGQALCASCDDAAVQGKIEQIDQKFRAGYRVAMPSLSPLVVGQSIVFRTATHLVALDFGTGRLRWRAPLEDALQHYLGGAVREAAYIQSDEFTRSLRRRVFEDQSFGGLSSDGYLVYCVEDLPFTVAPDYQRIAVTSDGNQRLDSGSFKQYNLLTAYDLRTGKLCWELGGSTDVKGADLAGAFFLGAPLPLGGRLYVVADWNGRKQLLEIDPSERLPAGRKSRLCASLTLAFEEEPRQPEVVNIMLARQTADTLRTGVSPSFADGVLVCRVGDDRFVAVELASRSVLWAYQVPDREVGLRRQWMMMVQQQNLDNADEDQANRWADQGVVIAEGRVLLTLPGSDEVVCLGLRDGRHHWSAPRRDGLYLGAVADGNVIVVGRGAVWALRIDDGEPAWRAERIALPAGALPSGRGYLAGDRYYVPLSTGEIAAVSVGDGRLVARARSPDGVIPGNLVACHDAVLSQSSRGIWRFETLTSLERKTAEALTDHPDDADWLVRRGEVLACQGRLEEAVELLQRALDRQPSAAARRALAYALSDGLVARFDAFKAQAARLGDSFEEPDQRCRLLRHLAEGLAQSGDQLAAFEAYWRLLDAESRPDEMERVEAARAVRRDRWLAARLEAVYRAGDEQAVEQIDRWIEQRLAELPPRRAMDYLGWHPATQRVCLRYAAELTEQGKLREAEFLLHVVRMRGNLAEQREATARLAVLLAKAGQAEAAAGVCRLLASGYADEECLDGKTGSALVEALAADDLVRRALQPPKPWPSGAVRAELDPKQQNVMYCFGVPITDAALAGTVPPLPTTESVHADVNTRRLFGRDRLGRKTWELTISGQDATWQFAFGAQRSIEGYRVGQLLFLWLGNRVCAIDLLGAQPAILWKCDAFENGQAMARRGIWGGMMPNQPNPMAAAEAMPMVASAVQVALLRDRKLVALSASDGKTLWMRDDCSPGSSLFGDDEILLVVPPDAEEAAVFAASDGRELGRCRVPPVKQHMARLGRRVLVWHADQDRNELALVDPWANRTLWQRFFPAKSVPWPIDAGEVAVVEPDGRLSTFESASGRQILQAQLEPEATPDFLFVQRGADFDLVVVNRAATAAPMIFFHPWASQAQINGQMYAVDRPSGAVRWRAEIQNQSMSLDQPPDLPLVVMLNCSQEVKENRVDAKTRILVLDRRTGREVYRHEKPQHAGNQLQIESDPDANRVEVRSFLGTLRFTLTDEAESAQPPADRGAAKTTDAVKTTDAANRPANRDNDQPDEDARKAAEEQGLEIMEELEDGDTPKPEQPKGGVAGAILRALKILPR